jgi:hypothetical protein
MFIADELFSVEKQYFKLHFPRLVTLLIRIAKLHSGLPYWLRRRLFMI